jgi:prepilin-type N-terminal cleavage/methylation domain-containing protein
MLHPAPSARRAGAFTLIELLIVVAIIAILAAIAVPNFIDAQARSKVSRALSDLRSTRTAIESYAVDNNTYPRQTWGCTYDDHYGPTMREVYGTVVPWPSKTSSGADSDKGVGGCLTTPIAYITSLPRDPFVPLGYQGEYAEQGGDLYRFWETETLRDLANFPACPAITPGYIWAEPGPADLIRFENLAGKYVLLTVGPMGPDGAVADSHETNRAHLFLQYDPTNGTASTGSVFVTQKHFQPTYVNPARMRWWPAGSIP